MVLAANRVIDGRTLLVLVAVTRPAHAAAHRTDHDDDHHHDPGRRRPPATTTTTTHPSGTTTTTTTVPLNDLPVADPFKYAGPTT